MKNIKYLIMDVDGTLTDGKIYMGNSGEMFKAFNIKDGCGIKDILPQYNITPVIITARESKMLSNRCSELDIADLYQGCRDKLKLLEKILHEKSIADSGDYGLNNCAYIGDDILDLQCMLPIKAAGGIVGCPADAVRNVIDIADFVSSKNGGDGAVREFIEWLTNADLKPERPI
jgi:3-deoxy-D-manno-octulosonate 8-phosphate phosphatase (KDO 8-P phosphatase)